MWDDTNNFCWRSFLGGLAPGLLGLLVGRSKSGVNAVAFLRYVTMSIVFVFRVGMRPFGMAWAGRSLLVHVVVDYRPGGGGGARPDGGITRRVGASARGGHGALGSVIIVHDVMLVLVVAAAIVAFAFMATVLAIAVAAMTVLVRCLVAGVVAAVVAMASIAAVMAAVSIMAVVAVTIVSIARTSSTSITAGRLGTAFARFLRARFLGGLLGFLLLELVEYAVCSIGALALLEEANKCDVIVGQSLVRLRILLLMLPRHREEDLLDLLRLRGQLHR